MTVTDKALILGFLLTGMITYCAVDDGGDSAQRAVAVRSNGRLAYRLPATDTSRDTDAAVIEQPDGLLVIDDSLSSGLAASVVARIKSSSEKPVKFLIYSHDKGDRAPQDRAYREAWPNIVIISTADEAPAGAVKEATSSALALGEDYLTGRLAHLNFVPAVADGWRAIADAVKQIADVYKCLMQTHVRLSFTPQKKPPCNDG